MCSSCFAWAEKGAAPVSVEQNRNKGEGVMHGYFMSPLLLMQLESGIGG